MTSPFLQGRAYGWIFGGGGNLLAAHCVYILVAAGWTMAIMTPFFFIIKKLGIYRVSAGEEGMACGLGGGGS
jgi:Amt family ammonium transporter